VGNPCGARRSTGGSILCGVRDIASTEVRKESSEREFHNSGEDDWQRKNSQQQKKKIQ
jgi:hypothetical protein